MLSTIPRLQPVPAGSIGTGCPRRYELVRPPTVQTDAQADAHVAQLLEGRADVELVSSPIIGRDRLSRDVIVVQVKPSGASVRSVGTVHMH